LSWERMRIWRLSNGYYILNSLKTGNNLQIRPNGHAIFANKNKLRWEWFRIEQKGADIFFVSGHTGRVVQTRPNGQCWAANHNRLTWERFRIVDGRRRDLLVNNHKCVGPYPNKSKCW